MLVDQDADVAVIAFPSVDQENEAWRQGDKELSTEDDVADHDWHAPVPKVDDVSRAFARLDRKRRVQRYYDKNATTYDTQHGTTSAGYEHNFRNYYEPFLGSAIKPGWRVLEIGCGSGAYTRWLLDHGCKVVAMDISEQILARAGERCPEATLVHGDCEDPAISLDEETIGEGFDAVLGVNTFSYFPDKRSAIARCRALLRPGGRIVLLDMNGRCPLYRAMAWMGRNDIRVSFGDVRQSTKSSLTRLARQAGMRISRLDHFAFLPNGISPRALRLLQPVERLLRRMPGAGRFAMRVGLIAEDV